MFKRTCGESIYPVLECLKSETMKGNWWIPYTERTVHVLASGDTRVRQGGKGGETI